MRGPITVLNLANPVQLSGVALLAVLSLATRSWTIAATAAILICFSAAVAAPHERDDLSRRHGAAWVSYRSAVRAWWPRWRPYSAALGAALPRQYPPEGARVWRAHEKS